MNCYLVQEASYHLFSVKPALWQAMVFEFESLCVATMCLPLVTGVFIARLDLFKAKVAELIIDGCCKR
jgi:hypothetical protein